MLKVRPNTLLVSPKALLIVVVDICAMSCVKTPLLSVYIVSSLISSFLKLNNITFYITEDLNYELIGMKEPIFSEYVLPMGSPYLWAQNNRGRIVDEVPIEDVHPGVLGHRGYAKELVSYLELKHR